MDKLDEKDIENLAKLVRVNISAQEKTDLVKDVPAILNYVSQIGTVDVSGVSIEDNLIVKNVLREDVAIPFDGDPADLIAMSEDSENGFVKVKRIL